MTEKDFEIRLSYIAKIITKIRMDEKGCWRWTGYITNSGYASISYKNKEVLGHRLSYLAFKGSISNGLEIDHLCRVRDCINPNHLEAVTRRENVLRGEAPSAKHALKTHCPLGHNYDPQKAPNGQRVCKMCKKINQRKYYLKNKIKIKKQQRDYYYNVWLPKNSKDVSKSGK